MKIINLFGEFSITEEKKEEFNVLILKLLDMCGIRKLKEITIVKNKFTVISKLKTDSKGLVFFDYCIFEGIQRNISSYNVNTCELLLDDCGFGEFALAMLLVMVMQESYSSSPCYLVREHKIIDINRLSSLIENIIGIQLEFPHRRNIWEMYLVCKELYKDSKLGWGQIFDWIPYSCDTVDWNLVWEVERIANEDDIKYEFRKLSREQIELSESIEREECLYWIYVELLNDDKLIPYVKKLVKSSYQERKIMTEDKTQYGTIAELSLYVTAITIIRILARVKKIDFWSLWNELSEDSVYQDYINKEIDRKIERDEVNFYEILSKDNEDEMLGVWNNRKLKLSDDMKDAIDRWKKQYRTIVVPDDFIVEQELIGIINDLKDGWHIEYFDETFINEFIENKEAYLYKKALVLLRQIMDCVAELYPELTKQQAFRWIIRHSRDEFEEVEMGSMVRVLGNRITREELLGF